MHAFSLESKIGTSFSTVVGIDEEFSRPHTLLTIDHHFLQLISGLLKSLFALFSKSYERGYNVHVRLSPITFPHDWRWTFIMKLEQAVPPPNCNAHFTIHPEFIVFNGIYF